MYLFFTATFNNGDNLIRCKTDWVPEEKKSSSDKAQEFENKANCSCASIIKSSTILHWDGNFSM